MATAMAAGRDRRESRSGLQARRRSSQDLDAAGVIYTLP
jgi:hypothetical protein